MSSILPKTRLEQVSYFENHNPIWLAAATAIGTTSAAITALTTKTAAARAAYNAQQVAFNGARTATSAYHEAVRVMYDAGADVLKQVKAKAATDGIAIYNLADVVPPAPPSPRPAPGRPDNFAATLTPTGALDLAWKCANPAGSAGTVYQIARRLGPAGAFAIIGTAGQRKFTDDSVPAGTTQVTYRIQALRSTVAGMANEFTVSFGVSGGGAMTASVVSSPKLAA